MVDGFTIFGIKIYFYALIIIAGALLAAVLASKEAKRRGFDSDIVWDLLPWLLMAGIIGARIWHVLTPDSTLLINGKNPYFIHPLQIFNIRKGGLGIPGAVMAGVLALWIYCRRKKLSFMTWVDIVAPAVALGQAVGRWGNFFNQECMVCPPIFPGQFGSIQHTDCPVLKISKPIIPPSSTNLSGIC
ncbi:MAG TPA: prolipoprotein diacylglyceryl transferase [Anaerolineaceae bacterium]|nr:prolipoprotein diacylglyceryl transferase [Anaerolineaceae bacterium]